MRETRYRTQRVFSAILKVLEFVLLVVGSRKMTQAVGTSNRTFWSVSRHCPIQFTDIVSYK